MDLTKLPEEAVLCYFAGLIDGEGCLKLGKHGNRKRPIIQLQMTHEETVRTFADYFGLTLRVPASPSRVKGMVEKGHKQIYHARTECRRAYEIIKKLFPYLITKREDAIVAMDYYDKQRCTICSNPIPYTRSEGSLTCSEECYRVHKRKYDRDYRAALKTKRGIAGSAGV